MMFKNHAHSDVINKPSHSVLRLGDNILIIQLFSCAFRLGRSNLNKNK